MDRVARPVVYGERGNELAEAVRSYMMKEREQHLACVDELERSLGIDPRTSELRKWFREQRRELDESGP